MTNKCNENLYVKPVEICNFKALKKLKEKTNDVIYNSNLNYIFDDSLKSSLSDLNLEFRNINGNEFKFKEKNDKKHFCGLINDEDYYLNCVIQTNNPLFTFKDGNCVVYPEVLGTTFNRVEVNGEISLFPKDIKDEEGNFKYSHNDNNNKFCEDRWFDWIITPNYHFGNRVFKDSGAYSKEDVKKCYIPCGNGYLPYTSSTGVNMCVSKEMANDGLYANKLDYSPIALINLIGNNKKHLNLLYRNLFLYKLKKKDTFDINNNHDFTINLENDDNYIINNALKEIKGVLENIVNDNNIDIPDYSTEYKHLTYKHPNFKEDDLLTLDGLDKNDILSNDIILIHTAYLANEYKKFLDILINDNREAFLNEKKDTIEIEKYNKHPFNINNVLEQNGIIRYLDKYPNVEIKIVFEKEKNPDNYKTRIIRQRLANILYKAINICYDNKTDFSKNIIYKTNQAIRNYNKLIDFEAKLKNKKNENFIKFNENKHYDLGVFDELIITYYKNDKLKEIYARYDTDETKNTKEKDPEKNYFRISKTNVYSSVKDFYDGFKKNFENNFIFYTEENSEIINNNTCLSNQFRNKDGNCKECKDECNKDTCNNNNDCKLYCNVYCKKFDVNDNDIKQQSICGITSKGDETNDYINQEEIKTPIEEETNIPNFSYIFKSAIRIFFILIIIYIGYMFYKLFNEQIMTLINALVGIYDWISLLGYDDIKKNEYYKDVIQNKYNRVIRKTMS